MIKSIISILLSIIMFASPVSVIANKSYSKANLKKDEFSISGKTSIGEIISNAFSKYDSDEAVDQNTSIKDVTSSNNVVTINLTNKEDCSVLVGIYDEKTLNLIADSIKKVKSSDDQSVTISFDEKLPENYIVKAVAVDKNNEAICNVYTDNDNTEWYKEFISSTIDDYSKKKVINFDNSNDDNFAVFNDDVVVLSNNNLIANVSDDKKTISLLLNEETKLLKEGDIIAYNTDNSEDAVVGKIVGVSSNFNSVDVSLKCPDLDETFEIVKIHYNEKEALMEEKSSGELETDLFSAPKSTMRAVGSGSISGSASKSKTWSFKYGSITFSAGANAVFEYNVWKKYAYASVTVTPSANLHINTSYSANKEIKVGEVYIPIVAGVAVTVPVTVVMKFSASITFDTTITAKFGFSWSTTSGVKNLSTKPKVNSSLTIEGHFYIGIKVSPSIDLLWGICKGGMTGQAGAQLNATAKWEYMTGQKEKHDCGVACIYCDVDVPLSVSAYLKISALGWTPVDKSWSLWSTTFNDVITFHYSIKYREFGWGSCSHKSYLTTIKVIDQNGNLIKSAKVDGTAVGSNGMVQKWYSDGRHKISVKASGYKSKNKNIGVSSAKTYIVELNKGNSTEIDEETDSSYTAYTKKKRSYSNGGSGGNSGSYVAPLQYIEPRTGVVLSTAVSGQRRNDTAWVQRELKKLSYFNSEPDGYFGYSTAEAVKKFQSDYNLPITGKVNTNVVEVIKKPLKMVSSPNLKLTSASKITNGDIVSVSWDAVPGASEYNVYVYNENGKMVANAIGTKSTNAAFVLYEKGIYTIKAEAKNDRFTSSVSTLETLITVTAPLLVIFENDDGTVLCKQYVAYGAAATSPSAPEKEGHTFWKWDTDFSKVTVDGLVVKPLFIKNQYVVRFLNTDGKEIITEKSKYKFGENAVAPDSSLITVPNGYKFIGWDKNFKNIHEDITIRPVIVWENDDLPILIDECQVVKDDDYGYNVTVKIRNYEKSRTNGRIVVALKTTDEKFVAMTESSAFTLVKSNAANSFVSTETLDIFVPCKSSQIAYADVYVVNTYDDLIPISDTYRVNLTKQNDDSGDNVSKSLVYSVSVDPSLAGKRAILFINKIGDAADFTNEYIGQTVIGENGECSFNYNLREELSTETGDYYVVLGIEGAEKAIFLEKMEAPKPVYTVTFKNFDGSVLKTEQVVQGEHATIPEKNPERDGYTFVGWDYTNSAIFEDLTITAVYAHKTYTVVFVDWTNKRFDAHTYYYGEPLRMPNLSTLDDYNAIGWEDAVEGMPVTKNMVITAKYEKKQFTVNFYDQNGNIIDTQVVEYGESATAPELENNEINFFGWDAENLNYVTSSLDVKPYFSYSEDTASPYASVESGIYSDTCEVILNCDDNNANIYYSINGSDFTLYSAPITVARTSTLEYYASSFGKNNSNSVSNYYIINRLNDEQNWKVPVTIVKDGNIVGTYIVAYGSTVAGNNLYTADEGTNFIGFYLNENNDDIISHDYAFITPVVLYVKAEAKTYTITFKDVNGNVIDVQNVAYMGAAEEPDVVIEQPDVIFVGWDTDDFLCVTKDMEVNAVAVNEKDFLAVKLNRDSYTMMEGYTYTFNASITGETEAELFWESSDESIATVDENGKVTAISDGIVVITAQLLGTDVSANCYITILKNSDMSIVLKDNSSYVIYDNFICGISPSSNTVSAVKEQINAPNVKLFKDNEELNNTDNVSTGTVVKMYDDNNNEIDSLTVVVVGDINGDGEATLTDSSKILNYLIKKEEFGEIELLAADVNADGEVNNIDASMIMRYQANKEQL